MISYLATKGAQYEYAHAKPAAVIASTARYDEICGGAGPSVTETVNIIIKVSVYYIISDLIP